MIEPEQIEELTTQTNAVAEHDEAQRRNGSPENAFSATNPRADDEELSNDEIEEEEEEDDEVQSSETGESKISKTNVEKAANSRKRRQPKHDAKEQRLLGRRALCKRIENIVPHMLKTVKLRVLGRYLESTRGINESDLTAKIIKDAQKNI